MNNDYSGNRRLSCARLLAVMAAIAVLAAVTACGGRASSSGSASGESANQKMLAYSECMRKNGVPDFPDPNASGNIQVAPGNPNDPINSPQEQVANNICRHLEPGGGVSNPAAQQQTVNQLLKMAQCMRKNGMPNFPDPQVTNVNGGENITLPLSSAGITNFNSPQFQHAERACKSLIPPGTFPSPS
jgi:hypothetical protein